MPIGFMRLLARKETPSEEFTPFAQVIQVGRRRWRVTLFTKENRFNEYDSYLLGDHVAYVRGNRERVSKKAARLLERALRIQEEDEARRNGVFNVYGSRVY
jgi:hypothetical protein